MVVDIRHSSFIVGYVLFIMVGNIMEIDKDTPSESDEDIEPDINIPTLRQAPRTRSGTRGVIASFSEAIEGLFAKNNTSSNLEDITSRLDKLSISGSEAKEDAPYVIHGGPKDDAILWSILPFKEMVSLFTISPLK
ncbi:hypothetical protein F2Q70_00030452 [Brassica cretica]|uniref:Uncharacterized protein n=3 Tax=Brassica TaxID=3705 RepID=A0A3N6TD03_BRACR|nr:hypothetical protein F2Q70_00030452 [Brassica cretica]KAF2554168.1 hypothetical protein F2Q68_00034900 [Brassica cretica]KAF3597700.1 hypothetical protein DY000_02023033 [Brassica cretica]CAF1967997.1 unnamed protein product [Brassica napus]